MSTIVAVAGSPRPSSATHAVLSHVERRFVGRGHAVRQITLRDLPPAALLAGDAADPDIDDAVHAVADADAVVVATPIYQAAYSGLTKVFLDLLPQFALRGKTVLPLATGGSLAHVLAVDYALRPVLTSLGADHVAPGWFVSTDHIRLFPDGGVLLDPADAGPLAEVVEAFLDDVDRRAGSAPAPRGAPESGVLDPAAVQVRQVVIGDPALAPLLADLVVEYGTRYGRSLTEPLLSEVPETDFLPPRGTFLVLQAEGETVAGGALRRRDEQTAEVKRIWTSGRYRRQGLAHRVLTELERAAAGLGYTRLYLTTGPRQPEARSLYLSTGYQPLFDVTADPETIGPLPFAKMIRTETLLSVVPAGDLPATNRGTGEPAAATRTQAH